jgi:hypothetical protein
MEGGKRCGKHRHARNVHAGYVADGICQILGLAIVRRPVEIPDAKENGIGESALNGTRDIPIISNPTICTRNLKLNPSVYQHPPKVQPNQ